MEKSIFRTVLFYTTMQLLFICIFLPFGKVPLISVLFYSSMSIALHFFLYIFLNYFKTAFFNLSTNKPLDKINTANRITLLRISSLPTIAFLLHHKELAEIKIILPIILGMVFLTDSFDGQIARRRKQITRMGQMLDSISDYSLLAVISIVYYRNNILPHWFFYLIFFRLFLQAFGMLVFILIKKPVETKSTWGGKITIAITMALYLFELIRLYLPPSWREFFSIIEYICGGIIFLLCFEKATIFFKQGKKKKELEAVFTSNPVKSSGIKENHG